MATETSRRVLCAQCEQSESRCCCDKFCILCQSELDVHLCMDGLLYCETCRMACDYKTVESVSRQKSHGGNDSHDKE